MSLVMNSKDSKERGCSLKLPTQLQSNLRSPFAPDRRIAKRELNAAVSSQRATSMCIGSRNELASTKDDYCGSTVHTHRSRHDRRWLEPPAHGVLRSLCWAVLECLFMQTYTPVKGLCTGK